MLAHVRLVIWGILFTISGRMVDTIAHASCVVGWLFGGGGLAGALTGMSFGSSASRNGTAVFVVGPSSLTMVLTGGVTLDSLINLGLCFLPGLRRGS